MLRISKKVLLYINSAIQDVRERDTPENKVKDKKWKDTYQTAAEVVAAFSTSGFGSLSSFSSRASTMEGPAPEYPGQ